MFKTKIIKYLLPKVNCSRILRVVHRLRWQAFGFFWPPTPLRWHFLRYKRWQKVDILGQPTYLPCPVNVVCEQPLRKVNGDKFPLSPYLPTALLWSQEFRCFLARQSRKLKRDDHLRFYGSYQSKTNGNDSYLPTYMDIARNLLIR